MKRKFEMTKAPARDSQVLSPIKGEFVYIISRRAWVVNSFFQISTKIFYALVLLYILKNYVKINYICVIFK